MKGFCGRSQVKAVACVSRAKTAQTFCTRAIASLLAQKRVDSLLNFKPFLRRGIKLPPFEPVWAMPRSMQF